MESLLKKKISAIQSDCHATTVATCSHEYNYACLNLRPVIGFKYKRKQQ